MIGRELGHYRILEPIGSGGMGEVWRARDLRLHRDVAVKLLPEARERDDAARRRFRREAIALSQLNHPNIATIHDYDHQDGIDFLVMELVPGESLAQRLERGPLPEDEVRRLGIELARGLAAAHARGVLHRDLKPANLLITPDGRLKILDFGLSRLVESPPGASLSTQTDVAAGTLPYMAPEQLDLRPIDERTDLYAAGVVLYEAVTGRRPFDGGGSAQLLYAILNETPAAPAAIRSGISPGFTGVILRAMEKDPSRRQASATELAKELETGPLEEPGRARSIGRKARGALVPRRWIHTVSLGAIVTVLVFGTLCLRQGFRSGEAAASLAVLPLANLSGDPRQEFFADGMTEELITELSKISSLRVISRTSVMSYKNTRKQLPQIARELRVGRVVEGAVTRAGNRVRITAKLIQASPERQLWSEGFERDLREVLSLQADMAHAIARKIQVRLTPDERARLSAPRPVDPEAHDVYLRGRFLLTKGERALFDDALESFKRSTMIDPQYALGWAGLADAYYFLSNQFLSPMEAMPKARAAAERALAIDSLLAEAHAARGAVLSQYEWQWSAAERELRRAIELSPNYAQAHFYLGNLLQETGRLPESTVEMTRALELDPLSNLYEGWLAFSVYLSGRYDDAARRYRRLIENEPHEPSWHWSLALCEAHRSRFDEAVAEARLAARSGDAMPRTYLAITLALANRRAEAEAELRGLVELSRTSYVSPVAFASTYAAFGEKDRAFEWLDRAYRERAEELGWVMVDPTMTTLRSDPRFTALLRRMGLAS